MADITLTGFLGADPELKFTSGGKALANFSVAEGHRKRDASGEWQDDGTTWWRCTAWERQAEAAAESLRKGSRVVVTGQVRSRQYEHNGQTKTSYDVKVNQVGLIPKGDRAQAQQGSGQPQGAAQPMNPWGTPQPDAGDPPF